MEAVPPTLRVVKTYLIMSFLTKSQSWVCVGMTMLLYSVNKGTVRKGERRIDGTNK